MKILFQGDSITDAGRDKRNYHDMGNGYPKYAAELIKKAFPDADIEFINLGISGNRTDQLFDRMHEDILQINPDIVSILICINDIWHRYSHNIATTDAQIEANYRAILERIRSQSNAKIMILSPFLLDDEEKEVWRPELERLLPIVRSLADEYADVYLPLDEIFAKALPLQPEPKYYSADGAHPNEIGAALIGKHYFEAIAPLVESAIHT